MRFCATTREGPLCHQIEYSKHRVGRAKENADHEQRDKDKHDAQPGVKRSMPEWACEHKSARLFVHDVPRVFVAGCAELAFLEVTLGAGTTVRACANVQCGVISILMQTGAAIAPAYSSPHPLYPTSLVKGGESVILPPRQRWEGGLHGRTHGEACAEPKTASWKAPACNPARDAFAPPRRSSALRPATFGSRRGRSRPAAILPQTIGHGVIGAQI